MRAHNGPRSRTLPLAAGLISAAFVTDPVVAEDPAAGAVAAEACRALQILDFGESIATPVGLSAVLPLPGSAASPAACRIAGVVGGEAGFDLRLPVLAWSGRLLVLNCAGACGFPGTDLVDEALRRGYATATVTEPAGRDVADGATGPRHDATHLVSRVAREIVIGYYGDVPDSSYFIRCTDAGLVETSGLHPLPDPQLCSEPSGDEAGAVLTALERRVEEARAPAAR